MIFMDNEGNLREYLASYSIEALELDRRGQEIVRYIEELARTEMGP